MAKWAESLGEKSYDVWTVSIIVRMFSSGVPAWTLWHEQQM
jgi:hypothetical protein